jgi:hypothetical protein
LGITKGKIVERLQVRFPLSNSLFVQLSEPVAKNVQDVKQDLLGKKKDLWQL